MIPVPVEIRITKTKDNGQCAIREMDVYVDGRAIGSHFIIVENDAEIARRTAFGLVSEHAKALGACIVQSATNHLGNEAATFLLVRDAEKYKTTKGLAFVLQEVQP